MTSRRKARRSRTVYWDPLFLDRRGKWRWRCRSRNGLTLCTSSQGYDRPSLAAENARLFGAPAIIRKSTTAIARKVRA